MRAMVYRGPYKIRVEEKKMPPIEHSNDAIVRVQMAAICGSDLLTPVFGTFTPPRGRSGVVRRYAHHYSEGRAAH